MMVLAGSVEERTAADATQGMTNKPDLGPAGAAQVLGIPAVDPAAASATARRIEPVHQTIEAIQ
jgi:hypothetical protein